MSGLGTSVKASSRVLPPGLTLTHAIRSRLKEREVSTRKQVGDTESMVNEEPTAPIQRVGDWRNPGWNDEEVV